LINEKLKIKSMKNIIICPNCQSVWGFDEIQWEHCDCCGFPDCDFDEENDLEYDDDEG
jgi:hypothetical protein